MEYLPDIGNLSGKRIENAFQYTQICAGRLSSPDSSEILSSAAGRMGAHAPSEDIARIDLGSLLTVWCPD